MQLRTEQLLLGRESATHIGKSSIWSQYPLYLEEPTPKRLCTVVLVVAIDLGFDFALGLGTGGMYGTIFIETEGANEEMLQEEAI